MPLPETALVKQWLSATEVRQRVQIIQQIKTEVMKENEHYGVIPGCKKPSLWKAGTEQLLMTFQLACEPIVLDLSTPDCAHYRVTCRITHAPTGSYLGSGVGEASTDETKYKWRAATCPAEYENTTADRRRIVWKQGNRGNEFSTFQVRTEVADVANTVLKMAKKRAQVDAVLTVTAASDIFTQDLEDMDAPVVDDSEAINQDSPSSEPVMQMPQRKNAAPQTPVRPAPAQQRPSVPQPAPVRDSGEVISQEQSRRFFAIFMQAGYTKQEIKNYLQRNYGITDDRQILKKDYNTIVAAVEGRNI